MKRGGAIAAGDPHTAAAGAAMLDAGGTAVDAAVAAIFASFVCEAPLGSPAGAGVLLFGSPDQGFRVVDFFARAPGQGLATRPDLDFHAVEIDFGPTRQRFHIGRAAAAVPTAAFGLLAAHRLGGRLPLPEVLAPAVQLARRGYKLSAALQWAFTLLKPILANTPELAVIHGLTAGLPQAGDVLRNPALGDFLEALGREGEALLRGPYTDAVLAAFGPERGGLLTRADLQAYTPAIREPLRVRFGAHEVLCNPAPAVGGALVALGLTLASGIDLRRHAFGSPQHLREVAAVLGAVHDARVHSAIDTHITEPGFVERFLASSPEWARTQHALAGEPPLGSTTHVSAVDAQGGAASLTVTAGEGCGHLVPGLGVHMNNLLGEEDINPLGFHQLPPGAPMSTMMAPTIVVSPGSSLLVLGSGGSNRIRSALLQALVNALVFERPLDEVVNAPRMHVEGRHLWFEVGDLGGPSTAALRSQWPHHSEFPGRSMFFGGVHAVRGGPTGLDAAGDQRRGGAVAIAPTA